MAETVVNLHMMDVTVRISLVEVGELSLPTCGNLVAIEATITFTDVGSERKVAQAQSSCCACMASALVSVTLAKGCCMSGGRFDLGRAR